MNIGQQSASLERLSRRIEIQMQRDLKELETTGRLRPLAPVLPLTRRPHNQAWVVVRGMLVTGVTIGGPVFAIAAVLQGQATTGGSPLAQGVLVGLMWALLVGVPASVLPGVLVGLVLQRREISKRLQAQQQQSLAALTLTRENVRRRLEEGILTPAQAVQELYGPRHSVSLAPTVAADEPTDIYPLTVPQAGRPVQPLELLILASAVADLSGGYVNVDHGENSTPATVQRILLDGSAPERNLIKMLRHNESEAMEVVSWVGQASPGDGYMQHLHKSLSRSGIEPTDRAAVTLTASAVGALRRAKALGLA